MHRIVVISDTQIPFEDKRALSNVINFIHLTQPNEVVQVGDFMDFPTPSRWSKGTAAEFQGSVFKDADAGKKYLERLRSDFNGPIKVIEGNHDERPATYLAKYAPALAESNAFDLDVLLDFNTYCVDLVRGFYDFAPNWTMTHGHYGFSLSQISGTTARNAAKKIGMGVIMGHTHRMARTSETFGKDGKDIELTGVEVGHLMDKKKASYLKNGIANWEQGFATVDVDDKKHVQVNVIKVNKDGTFIVDGKKYGGKP